MSKSHASFRPVLDFGAFPSLGGVFCLDSLAIGSVLRLAFRPHRSAGRKSAASFPKIGDHRPTDWKTDQRAGTMPRDGVDGIACEIHGQDANRQPSPPYLLPCQPDSCTATPRSDRRHEENGQGGSNLLERGLRPPVYGPHKIQSTARHEQRRHRSRASGRAESKERHQQLHPHRQASRHAALLRCSRPKV